MIVLTMLATMAAIAAQPVKTSYEVAQPVDAVRRCILLNSDRETREVRDGDTTMIGLSAMSRFGAVVSLSPMAGGTRVELRGNGLTGNEQACVKPMA